MSFLPSRRPRAQQGKQRRWGPSLAGASPFHGRNLGSGSPHGDLAGNEMHSILLLIQKPENDRSDIDQTWKPIVSGLQQCAARVRGVITVCDNCWLIPAQEKGLLFFDHAIAVAGEARLHCRICLLRPPDNETAPRLNGQAGDRTSGAAVRPLQGAVNLVLKWMARAAVA
jgi:hypothetical protein